MVKPTIDNTLYRHLKKALNMALPLEYAIRAAQKESPEDMEILRGLDTRLRQIWSSHGVSEEEVFHENLMDHSWDLLQVGFMLSRTHGRVYDDSEFVNLIEAVLAEIQHDYKQQVDALAIPVSRRFRYCDLLQGNEIAGLVGQVAKCLDASKVYDRNDEIPLGKFVRSIREPVPLYPGANYSLQGAQVYDKRGCQFAITLRFDMEYEDIKAVLDEAIYQYAKTRESFEIGGATDEVSHKLINDFLTKDFSGELGHKEIARYDGFLSFLSGLYCWDRFSVYKAESRSRAMDLAVEDTLSLEGLSDIGYDDETIKKNYKKVQKRVSKFMGWFL